MKRSTVYWIIALFLLPVLLAFSRTPVAWLDETMNLDPAVQWHLYGAYVSKIWPNQGTERVFLAYLPLVEVFHLANLAWLPKTLAAIRLPFLLCFIAGLFTWVRLLESWKLKSGWLLLLVGLLACDRAVFEILRSGRSETLELAILAGTLCALFKNRMPLAALLAGLLWIAHPKLWALTGILSLFVLWKSEGLIRKLLAVVLIAAPAFLWMAWLGFPFEELRAQLLGQSAGHGADGNIVNRIWQHVWHRFLPYYAGQPWVPLLHLLTWWPAWKLMRKYGWNLKALPGLLWMGQDLFWMFILAPHYRYLPPHQLLMYTVWAIWIAEKDWALPYRMRLAMFAVVPLLLFPWASRLAYAFLQWEARDPQAVINWLNRSLPVNGKTLLIGHSIGHYHLWQRQDTLLDFALEIYPQKFSFNNYDQVYYLGAELPRALSYIKPVATYTLQPPLLPVSLDNRSATYRGLQLYLLPDLKSMEALVGVYRKPYP
jgi:hypothetical protein